MSEVPTLNIRNVPERVVRSLKRRAKENGRSLNAEVVEALKEYEERHSQRADLRRRIEDLRRKLSLPHDAPTPEELIRAGHDDRDRRIAGDL